MLGLAARQAAACGIGLLAMYYFAYPPLFGPVLGGVSEGNYLLVNKNLVELFALSVVVAYPAAAFGLQSLLRRRGQAPVSVDPAAAGR
jgi:thiosulfate dehydrogenase [quinone] large subunit